MAEAEDVSSPDYEKMGPTQILPHLYIGCMKDALSLSTLKEKHISHVLNISTTCPRSEHITNEENFLRIPVNDGYIDRLLPHFDNTTQFIEKARKSGGCVLVHCMAGISRSAAVAVSYIMKTYNMSCEEAYRFVKSKRRIVSPNFNFLGQLLDYEKELKLQSPSTLSAGNKRKFIESLNLELGRDEKLKVSSPSDSKRLVVNNNNVGLHSLSPASALAGLRFEHNLPPVTISMHSPSELSLPSTSEVASAKLRLPVLSPTKRCHSMNSLAALTKGDTNSYLRMSRSRTMKSTRPSSLNLSTNNLDQYSSPNQLKFTRLESPMGLCEASPESPQLTFPTESSNSSEGLRFKIGDGSDTEYSNSLEQCSDLKTDSSSAPLTGFPAPDVISTPQVLSDRPVCETKQEVRLSRVSPKSPRISSAHTAPSCLSREANQLSPQTRHKRSRSLEQNLFGVATLCHKCSRSMDGCQCSVYVNHAAELNRSQSSSKNSLHNSSEMISVS